jgi:hypothetical protein
VSETDLYIGNKITVFGRELKLIEYLDNVTKNELMKKSERYVILILVNLLPINESIQTK